MKEAIHMKIEIETIKKTQSERILETENLASEQELQMQASPTEYKKWKIALFPPSSWGHKISPELLSCTRGLGCGLNPAGAVPVLW